MSVVLLSDIVIISIIMVINLIIIKCLLSLIHTIVVVEVFETNVVNIRLFLGTFFIAIVVYFVNPYYC